MTDIDDDLIPTPTDDDYHPAAYNDDPPPFPEHGWEDAAIRNLRRIARLERTRHETSERFRKEIDRLQDRLGAEMEKFDKQIAWHTTPLRQLHERLLAEDPERKTIVLPYGTLKSTTYAKAEPRVVDKQAFIDWAHVNAPHLLKVTFAPAPAQIGKEVAPGGGLHQAHVAVPGEPSPIVTDDGEQIPGVEMSVRKPVFTVKLDDEGWT